MANSTILRRPAKLTHSASLSTASTVEFTDLSTAYSMYKIVLTNIDKSSDGELELRTSTDNGSNYDAGASDYAWARTGITDSGAFGPSADSSDLWITLFDQSGGSGTDENMSGVVYLYRPQDTKYTRIVGRFQGTDTGGDIFNKSVVGARLTAADVDAIQILPSSGTITGEIRVYGYKDA